MKISSAFPSKYLKVEELEGKRRSAIINRVEMAEMQDQNGKTISKPVVYFFNMEKGLVLNVTMAKTIAKVLGDDTDHWTNHKLVMFPAMVDAWGETVEAIRCKVSDEVQPTKTQPPAMNGPVYNDTHMPNDDIPF